MIDSDTRKRVAVALLTLSAAGFGTWQTQEGWSSVPIIPTKGDVPTIGHGSTRYEDGTPVKMTDPPITRQRGAQLARGLAREDEAAVIKSLPGVWLTQTEFDVYVNFTGQFGQGNWRKSSMRRYLLAGEYRAACDALLRYRYSDGFDCSTPGNKVCYGVWTRQQKRHQACTEAL